MKGAEVAKEQPSSPATTVARREPRTWPRLWWLLVAVVLIGAVVVGGLWLRRGGALLVSISPSQSRIAAGASHTCAVTGDGHVKCWGNNVNGQLGNGTFERSMTPVQVLGVEDVVSLATGSGAHTCALTKAGGVKCWGDNEYGQLGNGNTTASSSAVAVVGLEQGALGIAVGRTHSCAVTNAGLSCWGTNASGELGIGGDEMSLSPVAVGGYDSRSAIALAASLTCGVTSKATLQCWGEDGDGQLGDSSFTSVATPQPVAGVSGPVTAVSASDTHVCATTSSAEVWCWGSNASGQLGIGSVSASSTPAKVPGIGGVTKLVAGFQRTCVINKTGSPECWGGVQDGTDKVGSTSPGTAPELGTDVADLSLGTFHGCLITTAGTVKCWGDNTNGQLGNGSSVSSAEPVTVKDV